MKAKLLTILTILFALTISIQAGIGVGESATGTLVSVETELKSDLLREYILEQNYPNPFNPTTVITYSIPKASYVSVKVFDVLGNTIATLVSQNQEVGSYKVNFDASTLSNGIYFYKINANNFISIKKMLLLK